MMDFALLPPEINSGRIYAGPGSGSMLSAAAAWDSLAVELRSTAATFSSAISGLTVDWQGPSSTAMVAAVEPYIAWLHATASQVEETGSRAKTAAAAYQTVLAAVVPPAAIAANRHLLSVLLATNFIGQNAGAIAATEAAYGQMWMQDAAAMYGYAEASSTAAQLGEFRQPPSTTHPRALDSGTLPTASPDAGAKSALSQLISATPDAPHSAASAAAADPVGLDPAALQTLLGLVSQVQAVGVVSVIVSLGIAATNLSATLDAAAATGAATALPVAAAGAPSLASTAQPSVAAETGAARIVGSLSVPPGWAAATPTVRLAAAALSATAPSASAVVTAGLDSAIGQMALASVAGNALGSTAGARVAEPAVPKGQRLSDDDGEPPEKLKRVLSQLAQEPESVQHWHTDKAHLDGLLEQLSTRPGIHTVHVSKKTTFKTRLSGPF